MIPDRRPAEIRKFQDIEFGSGIKYQTDQKIEYQGEI